MNKQIIGIIIGIFLISLASSLTINSGECEVINLDTIKQLYWTVSGNSSAIDGMNITYETFGNYTSIRVCLHPMFKEDSFTLIFIEEQTKEIVKEVPSGGGGGGTRIIENKTTEYRDVPYYITKEVPIEVMPEEPTELEPEEKPSLYGLILLAIIILIAIVVSIVKKRKSKKENE